MSEIQWVLVILGGFCLLAQIIIAGIGIAYAAKGGNNVKVGLAWGIFAALLFIAAVFI